MSKTSTPQLSPSTSETEISSLALSADLESKENSDAEAAASPEIVINHESLDAVIDQVKKYHLGLKNVEADYPLEPSFAAIKDFWKEYRTDDNADRKKLHIDVTLDAIIKQLEKLGDFGDLHTLKIGGKLRTYLHEFSAQDAMENYLRKMVVYVTKLANPQLTLEERIIRLQEFPLSIPNKEFNCLDGTEERLDFSLRKLQKTSAFIKAHEIVLGKGVHKFSSDVYEGNQVHIRGAIENILGFVNSDAHFQEITAKEIPAEKAYQFFLNYAANLTDALMEIRIDMAKKIMNEHEINSASIKLLMAAADLKESTVMTWLMEHSLEDEDGLNSKWNLEKIPELFANCDKTVIDNPLLQDLPTSLFAKDIAVKTATLIKSENRDQQKIGLKILAMMGNSIQLGSNILGFLRVILELGDGENNEDRYLHGKAILDSLANHADLEKIIEKVRGQDSYNAAYAQSIFFGDATKAETLIAILCCNALNNDVKWLIEQLADGEMDKVIAESASFIFNIFHNPERFLILQNLLHGEREITSQHATNLGAFLAALGAQYNDIEMIKYVQRGFLTLEEEVPEAAAAASPAKRYANGTEMVNMGLRITLGPEENQNTGLFYLTTRDARIFENIISNKELYDAVLTAENINILYKLIARKDVINFKEIFKRLTGPEITAAEKTILMQEIISGVDGTVLELIRFASKIGYVEIFDELLNARVLPAILMMPDQQGMTAAHYAAMNGKLNIIDKLIAVGIPLEQLMITDQNGGTLLHHAVESGATDIIARLVEKGVQLKDYITGDKNIIRTVVINDRADVIEQFLTLGITIEDLITLDAQGKNIIHEAVIYGAPNILRKLIPLIEKQELLRADIYNKTPTQYAAYYGKDEVVKVFIDAGLTAAELMAADNVGLTAAHFAVKRAKPKIIKALSAKVSPQELMAADQKELTPAHHAVMLGNHQEMLLALIDAGITPKELMKPTQLGSTLAHFAAHFKNFDALKMLTQLGIGIKEIMKENNAGHSPLDYADSQETKTLLETYISFSSIADDIAARAINNAQAKCTLQSMNEASDLIFLHLLKKFNVNAANPEKGLDPNILQQARDSIVKEAEKIKHCFTLQAYSAAAVTSEVEIDLAGIKEAFLDPNSSALAQSMTNLSLSQRPLAQAAAEQTDSPEEAKARD